MRKAINSGENGWETQGESEEKIATVSHHRFCRLNFVRLRA